MLLKVVQAQNFPKYRFQLSGIAERKILIPDYLRLQKVKSLYGSQKEGSMSSSGNI